MGSDEPIRTPLTPLHEEAGAKLVPFAGWLMPLEFQGTVAEHRVVRSAVGVFDVSHLGTVWITGAGAVDLVGWAFTKDPSALGDGQSQYTLAADEGGGIVDDLIVYRLSGERFLAIPNAANTAAVVARLQRGADELGAVVDDASHEWAILAVQGPDSLGTVESALGIDVGAVPHLSAVEPEVDGVDALVARTGYTGEVGCELVLPAAAAADFWQRLRGAGAVPAGLGARDTLRLEMGYPLHGNDLSTSTTPYEARLGWAVDLDRGPFTGQRALRAAKERGPDRRLWGLRGGTRRPPRAGMSVHHDGAEVGEVTSGSFSPTLEVGIGLAYLDDPLRPGATVEVDVRGTGVPFEVVKPPFVDRNPKG